MLTLSPVQPPEVPPEEWRTYPASWNGVPETFPGETESWWAVLLPSQEVVVMRYDVATATWWSWNGNIRPAPYFATTYARPVARIPIPAGKVLGFRP